MKYIADSTEMAQIDRYTTDDIGIPEMVLMERAALAVFDYIKTNYSKNPRRLLLSRAAITARTDLPLQGLC